MINFAAIKLSLHTDMTVNVSSTKRWLNKVHSDHMLSRFSPNVVHFQNSFAGRLSSKFVVDRLSQGFTSHPTQNRSFWRRPSEPISWLSTDKQKQRQQVRGLTYIHTWRSYVHTLRSCVREPKVNRCECRGDGGALADMSDFGLLGEQSSQKWEIPCLWRRWTAVQNLTLLALSTAKKSITVPYKKQTNTQTVSTPCLSACVDNKSKHA